MWVCGGGCVFVGASVRAKCGMVRVVAGALLCGTAHEIMTTAIKFCWLFATQAELRK